MIFHFACRWSGWELNTLNVFAPRWTLERSLCARFTPSLGKDAGTYRKGRICPNPLMWESAEVAVWKQNLFASRAAPLPSDPLVAVLVRDACRLRGRVSLWCRVVTEGCTAYRWALHSRTVAVWWGHVARWKEEMPQMYRPAWCCHAAQPPWGSLEHEAVIADAGWRRLRQGGSWVPNRLGQVWHLGNSGVK